MVPRNNIPFRWIENSRKDVALKCSAGRDELQEAAACRCTCCVLFIVFNLLHSLEDICKPLPLAYRQWAGWRDVSQRLGGGWRGLTVWCGFVSGCNNAPRTNVIALRACWPRIRSGAIFLSSQVNEARRALMMEIRIQRKLKSIGRRCHQLYIALNNVIILKCVRLQ